MKKRLHKEILKFSNIYLGRSLTNDEIKNYDIRSLPEELRVLIGDYRNLTTKFEFKSELKSRLAKNIRKKLKATEKKINENLILNKTEKEFLDILSNISNANFYLVGGCLRDAFLGNKIKDIDICTDLNYDDAKRVLLENGLKIKEVGKHFGVLLINFKGISFEIAVFRKDIGTDGRRPEKIESANIHEDAIRRDFTVNSGYMNIKKLELLDLTEQFVDDINSRVLRFIGKPDDRIKEDYLRVFRFYRFISKGFKPDKKSLRAVRKNFNLAVNVTASERIKSEIERIVDLNKVLS